MSEQSALLRAILERPEDDGARLVYADWLDENGEPERAEFVRVQCGAATLEKRAGHPFAYSCRCGHCEESRTPRARARALLVDFPAAPYWLGRGDPFHDSHPGRDVGDSHPLIRAFGAGVRPILFGFARGFVGTLAIETAAFLQHAAELFSRHPITEVRLTDREPRQIRSRADFGCYEWDAWADGRTRRPQDLPRELWDAFPHGSSTEYDTEAEAHAALSTAAVHYGRTIAGLSPLTRNLTPILTPARPTSALV